MRFATLVLSLVLVPLLLASCSSGSKDTVKVGALLPLTGALQSYGESSQAALVMARDSINANAKIKVELVIDDTATDPQKALSQLQALDKQGIKVVIGPYSSSEVAAVKDYADQNDMVLISPLSTAGSLATAGDNLYRFTPDDTKEGEAVAAVALDAGIKTIIPVSRDDTGNKGLQTAMKQAFEAGGGTVVDGVTYAADQTGFTSVVSDIAAAIDKAGSPPKSTAVYLTAFNEVVQLFDAATDNSTLKSVTWYGSDSVAQSAELIKDPTAAGFAVSAGYPNPILGLRDQDSALWTPVVEDLRGQLGRVPDSFALAAYDALIVAHTAIESAGVNASASAFGTALVKAASDHVGLTGPTVLNDAGDRASASFDFWSVCPAGASFTWTRTISYAVAADGSAKISHNSC